MQKVRWRRRSAARPSEIIDAALIEFARRGFAAARTADIAARAGLSKAALYVYFPAKTELFRAVLMQHAVPRLDRVREGMAASPSFAAALEGLLGGISGVMKQPELGCLARMVIAESGNFPELASLWRENVVDPAVQALAALLRRAQESGEVRPGDSRLMAFAIAGPMLMGMLWREVIEPAGGEALDLDALARELRTVLQQGLLAGRI